MTPQKVLDTMLAKDAFSRWLGLSVDEMGLGHCKLHFMITADMLNGFGTVHGGILFSAADSAFAFACNSHGRLSVALDVSITFTKAAKTNEKLTIEAKEVHLGNKTSVYQVTVTNENNETLAIFKGTAYRTSALLTD